MNEYFLQTLLFFSHAFLKTCQRLLESCALVVNPLLSNCLAIVSLKQDAHVREQSRICGTRNEFTSLIEF